jgi:hypothetical protein
MSKTVITAFCEIRKAAIGRTVKASIFVHIFLYFLSRIIRKGIIKIKM